MVKKGAPFAIVWRAAHGQLPGVSKRDRERVMIVAVANELRAPPVPLALSARAHLFYGTVTLYQEQRSCHFQRVQRAAKAIREAGARSRKPVLARESIPPTARCRLATKRPGPQTVTLCASRRLTARPEPVCVPSNRDTVWCASRGLTARAVRDRSTHFVRRPGWGRA